MMPSTPFRFVRLIVLALAVCVPRLSLAEEDPLRLADEIAKFEADRVANPPPDGAVLCVGSSSMGMWRYRMGADLQPLTVIPRGFGGSHFSDVLFYFDELVSVYKPRAILIYEGDNDLSSGKSPERVYSDFREFLRKVEEFDASIRVYVIGVKPSVARWHLKEQVAEANRLMAAACEVDPRLFYIDVSKGMLDEAGEPIPELFLEDGLHLNGDGYELWAAAVSSVLVGAEGRFEGELGN